MANPRPIPPKPGPDHPWRGRNEVNRHQSKLEKVYGRLSINGHSVSKGMRSLNLPAQLDTLLDEIGVVTPRSSPPSDGAETPIPLRQRETVIREKNGTYTVTHNGQIIGWVEVMGGGTWRATSIHGEHDVCDTRREAISRVHDMLA